MKHSIQSHPFPAGSLPFAIENLSYDNHYDYHKKHRHEYVELVVVEKGGGTQWIDFTEIVLSDYSCYIILPQQIHLLKKNAETTGTIVQFGTVFITDTALLSQLKILEHPILFEQDEKQFKVLMQFIALAQKTLSPHQAAYNSKVEGFLQHLCFHLLTINKKVLLPAESLYMRFVKLLEKQFREWHTVAKYTQTLGVTEQKLGKVVRAYRDQTPLQIIHQNLLVEAKRLLLFEEQSIKEVAYALGFSYPSNFTHFIKTKTGVSPSVLKKQNS